MQTSVAGRLHARTTQRALLGGMQKLQVRPLRSGSLVIVAGERRSANRTRWANQPQLNGAGGGVVVLDEAPVQQLSAADVVRQ